MKAIAGAGTGSSAFRKLRTWVRKSFHPFGLSRSTRGQCFPDQELCWTKDRGPLIASSDIHLGVHANLDADAGVVASRRAGVKSFFVRGQTLEDCRVVHGEVPSIRYARAHRQPLPSGGGRRSAARARAPGHGRSAARAIARRSRQATSSSARDARCELPDGAVVRHLGTGRIRGSAADTLLRCDALQAYAVARCAGHATETD